MARYVITGLALLGFDMGTFFLLVKVFEADPALAQFVARGSGAVAGFFGHKFFSFRNAEGTTAPIRQVVLYGVVTTITVCISPLVLMSLLVTQDSLIVAKLGTEVVMVAFNYLCLSKVFR